MYFGIESKIATLHGNLKDDFCFFRRKFRCLPQGVKMQKRTFAIDNICLRCNAFFLQCSFSQHSSFGRVSQSLHITKASCQAWLKLLIANEVRIGGLGGSVPKPANLRQFTNHLGWPPWSVLRPMYQVAIGDGGVRFPPGPSMDVHWGGQNRRKAMEELE